MMPLPMMTATSMAVPTPSAARRRPKSYPQSSPSALVGGRTTSSALAGSELMVTSVRFLTFRRVSGWE